MAILIVLILSLAWILDFDTYLFDVEDSGRSADQNHRKDRADKIATSITIQNKQPSLQHVELEMHKYKVVQVYVFLGF